MRALPCKKEMPFEVRQIKPSAMYFNQEKLKEIGNTTAVHVGGKGEFWRVCYSCHSSLQELLEFVKYLQPKSIIPTVLPNNTSETEVISLLAKVLENYFGNLWHDADSRIPDWVYRRWSAEVLDGFPRINGDLIRRLCMKQGKG